MPSRNCSVTSSLYGATLIVAFSQSIAVIIAKSLNSALSKTLTHGLACVELPGNASLRSLGTQLLLTSFLSFLTIIIWVGAVGISDENRQKKVSFTSAYDLKQE